MPYWSSALSRHLHGYARRRLDKAGLPEFSPVDPQTVMDDPVGYLAASGYGPAVAMSVFLLASVVVFGVTCCGACCCRKQRPKPRHSAFWLWAVLVALVGASAVTGAVTMSVYQEHLRADSKDALQIITDLNTYYNELRGEARRLRDLVSDVSLSIAKVSSHNLTTLATSATRSSLDSAVSASRNANQTAFDVLNSLDIGYDTDKVVSTAEDWIDRSFMYAQSTPLWATLLVLVITVSAAVWYMKEQRSGCDRCGAVTLASLTMCSFLFIALSATAMWTASVVVADVCTSPHPYLYQISVDPILVYYVECDDPAANPLNEHLDSVSSDLKGSTEPLDSLLNETTLPEDVRRDVQAAQQNLSSVSTELGTARELLACPKLNGLIDRVLDYSCGSLLVSLFAISITRLVTPFALSLWVLLTWFSQYKPSKHLEDENRPLVRFVD